MGFYSRYPLYSDKYWADMDAWKAAGRPDWDVNVNNSSPPSLFKPISYGMSMDPLLETGSIMGKIQDANKILTRPSTDFAKELLLPSFEMVKRDVGEQAGKMKAGFIDEAVKRGIIGSSTLEGQLTQEVPSWASRALADAETNLLLQGLPIAQQEKKLLAESIFREAETGITLRKMVGDEHYQKMSFEQKERLTKADQDLQFELKKIDQEFAEKMQEAEFNFQRAENEKDRRIAAQQYQQLLNAQRSARQNAFMSSMISMVGMGVGAYAAPAGMGWKYAMAGGMMGQQAGNSMGFLFD